MKKMMLRLLPLFFLMLLFFSCTKDNDLSSFEEGTEVMQSRESGEGEGPCNLPCRQPDFIQISDVTPCSAVIAWGHTAESCGSFKVEVQNLLTGAWTYYNPAVSPLTLIGLDRCTEYNVRIIHETNICASIPIQKSFITSCKSCRECEAPCADPDYAFVDNITQNSATANFGFNSNLCGYFTAELKNNDNGNITYFNPAVSPLALTNLNPCTSYTIGIAHVTDICSTEPLQINFMTECPQYCDATGLDPSCLHTQYVTLDFGQLPGIWVFPFSSQGYVDATNQVQTLVPGAVMPVTSTGHCTCGTLGGTVYSRLWIDANQNTIFEASELMYSNSVYLGTGGSNPTVSCVNRVMPGVTIPNVVACGMRARFILNQDPIDDPCATFATGQVVDFTINTTNCDI